jgi:hypothetical protein
MNYLIGVLVDKSQILETLTMWAFLQPILCLPLFLFLHLVRKILLFSKFAGKIPVRSIKPESIFSDDRLDFSRNSSICLANNYS